LEAKEEKRKQKPEIGGRWWIPEAKAEDWKKSGGNWWKSGEKRWITEA
jgi:hypothetical protein